MNGAGVQQAVKAFLETEPYCPRPHSQDPYLDNLWTIFSNNYVEVGKAALPSSSLRTLPAKFIEAVTDALSQRKPSLQSGGDGGQKTQNLDTPGMTGIGRLGRQRGGPTMEDAGQSMSRRGRGAGSRYRGRRGGRGRERGSRRGIDQSSDGQ